MDINRVTLCGRLCVDPEVKTTSTGKSYMRFSVATHRSWKDEKGDWKTQTEFHPVVAWGGLATRICEQCKKGESVFLEGELRHRQWQDAAGVRKFITEVVVDRLQPVRGEMPTMEKSEALPEVEEISIEEVKATV